MTQKEHKEHETLISTISKKAIVAIISATILGAGTIVITSMVSRGVDSNRLNAVEKGQELMRTEIEKKADMARVFEIKIDLENKINYKCEDLSKQIDLVIKLQDPTYPGWSKYKSVKK